MRIWKACKGEKYIKKQNCSGFRIVEDQTQSSTYQLVDGTAEHEYLEKLLDERSKPPYPKEAEQITYKNKYLLTTPFRYPPLRSGSRFGHYYERGIFYGAFELETALAEMAHRRKQFAKDTTAKLDVMDINLTSFKFDINGKTVDLTKTPFTKYSSKISATDNYGDSLPLGKDMRENNVEIFYFASARCKKGKNIGCFTPKVFTKGPYNLIHWKCTQTNQRILLISGNEKFEF